MTTKQKIKNLIIILIVMIILAITCIFYKNFNNFIYNFVFERLDVVTTENNLLVHFIDVGQGDAMAINFPNGEIMLIDTGVEDRNVDYVNYIKDNVLNNSRTSKIDYLVLTHAEMDHVGGTLKLLQTFEVGKVYLPYLDKNTDSYKEVKNYIVENCDYTYVSQDMSFDVLDCKISTFGPLDFDTQNETSPVIKVEYKDTSFLFAGDISSDVETELVEQFGDELDCDVLKVAHHGSKGSTSEEFLRETSPEYAVISVGENNGYGHPTEQTLDRLNYSGANVLRTDEDGNVLFVVGNYGLNFICGKFYITNLTLDYRIWVLVVECGLTVIVALTVFKKSKTEQDDK